MKNVVSIIGQTLLLSLALAAIVLRSWVRVRIERRVLTLPDYLVWCGWACAVGWVACSAKALYLQIEHPLEGEDLITDSVDYLKTVFAAAYLFDLSVYFPKFSLVAFFWWLIPHGFRSLRIAVYTATAFVGASFVSTILVDTFIAGDISNNWSIENQLLSTWNSYTALIVNWTLNFSTDLLLFALPFGLLKDLNLKKRQMIGLVGVFALGLITIAISLGRFLVYIVSAYSVDDASGNAWCTAEICTAIIVVSLPSLKALIVRSDPATSNSRSKGYVHTSSSRLNSKRGGASRVRVEDRDIDDEIGLVLQGRPDSVRTQETTPAEGKLKKEVDGGVVGTNKTITRDMV